MEQSNGIKYKSVLFGESQAWQIGIISVELATGLFYSDPFALRKTDFTLDITARLHRYLYPAVK